MMPEATVLNHRYRLEETMGAGGMAVVYRAYDLMLERTVAIKVLREDFSRDPGFRENFRQEAKAAANLSHPNIVTVHDFGLDAGRLFIVMEHVPGTELKSLLRKRRKLTIEESVDLMAQACAGVGYAHRAGLVHCDLKPQNMLITPDMRVKVTDFGIARALASIQEDEKAEIVWGSPQYFSPEQAAGAAPSPASDVYSLGVVMYEMLTGQLPFTAETGTELARMHREVLPLAPRQLDAALPAELEQILFKVLAKEPSARYRTADQFGRVLETFRQQHVLGISPAAVPPGHGPIPAGTVPSEIWQATPPSSGTPLARTAAGPLSQYPPTASRPLPPEPLEPPVSPLSIDWINITLGLLALIAVGGLIPFFLWVYFAYFPPVR